MNDKRSHARAWLAKAQSDQLAARRLHEAGGPYDAVCFHAQQACEKALKAALALREIDIPRTHNLVELQLRCVRALADPTASALSVFDLSQLTPYAVESRYDAEFWPERETADAAVKQADEVVNLVSKLLDERSDQDRGSNTGPSAE